MTKSMTSRWQSWWQVDDKVDDNFNKFDTFEPLTSTERLSTVSSPFLSIVAFGGGFKCLRKIHLNTQCPPRFRRPCELIMSFLLLMRELWQSISSPSFLLSCIFLLNCCLFFSCFFQKFQSNKVNNHQIIVDQILNKHLKWHYVLT